MSDTLSDPENCVFCGIVAGKIPSYRVAETEQALAFLDISQLTPGHTLVVPKRHVPDLLDADGTLAEIAPLVEEVARLLERRLEPAGVNLLQSSRAYAGQEVFHLHVHLLPRYRGDGGLPRLLDPGKQPVSADELAEIQAHLVEPA
jgi:histidine triad (HIT) family protein